MAGQKFLKNMKKSEFIFKNERVNIYKIKDCREYRKLLKNGEIDKIKKLAYFKSTKHNLITNKGLERIARVLAGNVNLSIVEIAPSICAIGDGTGTHTASSTQLFSEKYRKYVSSRESYQNKFLILSHYLPEECTGQFTEEGIFIAGDVETANSGVLLSVIALSQSEGNKTNTNALIIERLFTLSSS